MLSRRGGREGMDGCRTSDELSRPMREDEPYTAVLPWS